MNEGTKDLIKKCIGLFGIYAICKEFNIPVAPTDYRRSVYSQPTVSRGNYTTDAIRSIADEGVRTVNYSMKKKCADQIVYILKGNKDDFSGTIKSCAINSLRRISASTVNYEIKEYIAVLIAKIAAGEF